MAEPLLSEIDRLDDEKRERLFQYETLINARTNYGRAIEALNKKIARAVQVLAALAELSTACQLFPEGVEAVVRTVGDTRTLGSVGYTTRTYGCTRTFVGGLVEGTRDREEKRLSDFRVQLDTANERLENVVNAIATFESTAAA